MVFSRRTARPNLCYRGALRSFPPHRTAVLCKGLLLLKGFEVSGLDTQEAGISGRRAALLKEVRTMRGLAAPRSAVQRAALQGFSFSESFSSKWLCIAFSSIETPCDAPWGSARVLLGRSTVERPGLVLVDPKKSQAVRQRFSVASLGAARSCEVLRRDVTYGKGFLFWSSVAVLRCARPCAARDFFFRSFESSDFNPSCEVSFCRGACGQTEVARSETRSETPDSALRRYARSRLVPPRKGCNARVFLRLLRTGFQHRIVGPGYAWHRYAVRGAVTRCFATQGSFMREKSKPERANSKDCLPRRSVAPEFVRSDLFFLLRLFMHDRASYSYVWLGTAVHCKGLMSRGEAWHRVAARCRGGTARVLFERFTTVALRFCKDDAR